MSLKINFLSPFVQMNFPSLFVLETMVTRTNRDCEHAAVKANRESNSPTLAKFRKKHCYMYTLMQTLNITDEEGLQGFMED